MTDGAEIQHEVLQRTLAEVAQEKEKEKKEETMAATPCVICLETVSAGDCGALSTCEFRFYLPAQLARTAA